MLAVTLALTLAVPQMRVDPYRSEVGTEVSVSTERHGKPVAEVEVTVEGPDGAESPVGRSDAEGRVVFVPEQAGQHVFRAEVGGVQFLAPAQVVATRPRWLIALVCVPLGLALLWRNLSRERGRRDR